MRFAFPFLDREQPINWEHPLNKGVLVAHFTPVEGFVAGTRWRDLTFKHLARLETQTGSTNAPEPGWKPLMPPMPKAGILRGPGGMGFRNNNDNSGYGQSWNAGYSLLVKGSEITISAWMYLSGSNGDSRIIDRGTEWNTNTIVWMASLTNGGVAPRFRLSAGGANNATTLIGNNQFTTGKWYFVVFVFDGKLAANRMKIYVDGTLDAQTLGPANSIDEAYTGVNTKTRLYASNHNSGGLVPAGGKWFGGLNGFLNNIEIRNKALSQADIRWLCRESLKGYPELFNHDPIMVAVAADAGGIVSGAGSATGIGSATGLGYVETPGAGENDAGGINQGSGPVHTFGAGSSIGDADDSGTGFVETEGYGSNTGIGVNTGDGQVVSPGVVSGAGSQTGIGSHIGIGLVHTFGSGQLIGIGDHIGLGLVVTPGQSVLIGIGDNIGIGKVVTPGTGILIGEGSHVGTGYVVVPAYGNLVGIGESVGDPTIITWGEGELVGRGENTGNGVISGEVNEELFCTILLNQGPTQLTFKQKAPQILKFAE